MCTSRRHYTRRMHICQRLVQTRDTSDEAAGRGHHDGAEPMAACDYADMGYPFNRS
jgi:hypothetical protein